MRVLVVDDHTLFTDAITPILEDMDMSVRVVGTAEEALSVTRSWAPRLILMDIGLPDRSGLAVGRSILSERNEVTIVALTALGDPRAVDEALRAGFHGYITKDMPVGKLVQAIRSALDGQIVVPHRLGPRGPARRDWDEALLGSQLTPREVEVLTLLTRGLSGAAIARELGISANTVRTHVQSVLTKLQVHSRLEAAAFATRHGIVRPSGGSQAAMN